MTKAITVQLAFATFCVKFSQCQFGFPLFGNYQPAPSNTNFPFPFQQTGFQQPNQNFTFYQPQQNTFNAQNSNNFNNVLPQTTEFSENNTQSSNYDETSTSNQHLIETATTNNPTINITEQQVTTSSTEEVPSRIDKGISKTKCIEYSKLIQKKVQFTSLALGSSIQDISSKTCDSSTGLVIGGENARIDEFPHQTAIGYLVTGNLEFKCGGSLISELFILTAAHCRSYGRIPSSIVRLGDLNLKEKESELPEIDVPIESFISHEEYRRATKKNDIAVIKMKNAVTFSTSIRPACLQQVENFDKPTAIATGWGYTEVGKSSTDILQKVSLDIVSNEECETFYDDIYDTQMCAGGLTSGKDTCNGDSGGPLQISIGTQCLFTIIGVTSYGSTYCGAQPGVYTRISSYIDWIENKVWNTSL